MGSFILGARLAQPQRATGTAPDTAQRREDRAASGTSRSERVAIAAP